MSDSEIDSEEGNSFSPKRQRTKGEKISSGTESDPILSWQEQSYDRLKTLYDVSKLLSRVVDIEEIFPKVLALESAVFPISTATLIECRGKSAKTTFWHSEDATEEQIQRALANARQSFGYLTGSPPPTSDMKLDAIFSGNPDGSRNTQPGNLDKPKDYLVLPLLVDRLPAFGVLQLEGSGSTSEQDLEFVDALAHLMAVAVDRYYKTLDERELRKKEAKESAEKLSDSQQEVAELVDDRLLRESFVSLLTHDLRTPLSAAKISAQLIQRQADNPETFRSLAARIVDNISRTDRMVRDLLDANRIGSGEKLPLHIERFDLHSLVTETLEELGTVHGDRFQFVSDTHVQGFWDRESLRRVVENLCHNAVKYGSPDSPIQISLARKDVEVQLMVQNQGELISTEDQKTLFRQFRRTEKAQGSRRKGWGLGLTLVRGVAEAHGGNVKVESDSETGTVFTVTLPLDARPFVQIQES